MTHPTTTPTTGGESAAAEREARLAELRLERFTPATAAGSAHLGERAPIRQLDQGARRARLAAEMVRSAATASRGPRHHSAADVAEVGR